MTQPCIRLPLAAPELRRHREVLLAEPGGGDGEYTIRSIPAFIYGLAAGDQIRILDRSSGTYEVLRRGGQVTIRLFVAGSLDRPDVSNLINEVINVGGTYEVGKNISDVDRHSLLLISLPISLGFNKIEEFMKPAERSQMRWEYGNVYTQDGQPLNWWKT